MAKQRNPARTVVIPPETEAILAARRASPAGHQALSNLIDMIVQTLAEEALAEIASVEAENCPPDWVRLGKVSHPRAGIAVRSGAGRRKRLQGSS
jgi:hypothetical protein